MIEGLNRLIKKVMAREKMDGDRMRDLRRKAGLRQGEIALELGVHRNTVCGWERGSRRVSKVVEVSFVSLINDTEKIYWIKSSRKRKRKIMSFA
jgi:predicted transcriptional regulator